MNYRDLSHWPLMKTVTTFRFRLIAVFMLTLSAVSPATGVDAPAGTAKDALDQFPPGPEHPFGPFGYAVVTRRF